MSKSPSKSNIPINVFDEGSLDKLAARFQTPEVVKRISLAFAFMMSFLALVLGIAIMAMAPLKEKVPYFVEARPGGEVVASDKVAQRFEPTEQQMAYFMWHRFVMPLLTIDEQTKSRVKGIAPVLRGASEGQVIAYINEQKIFSKILEDPTLRQVVEPESRVDFFKTSKSTGTAVMWVVAKTTSSKAMPITQRMRVTLDYVILPVKEDKQVFSNPLGLYITGFRIENVYG